MNKLTDAEIVKWWEDEIRLAEYVDSDFRDGIEVDYIKLILDLINRQKAEIEKKDNLIEIADKMVESLKSKVKRLQKKREATETSGFKIENGKVVFYTNILNGYRHELKDLDEVVEELNLMLQLSYKADDIEGDLKALQKQYKTAKSEAIKEFVEQAIKGANLYVCSSGQEYVSVRHLKKLAKKKMAGVLIMAKLLPCPNCGSKETRRVHILSNTLPFWWYIECPNCHWCGKIKLFLWRAVRSWNKEKR